MPKALTTEALLALLHNEHDPEARSSAIEEIATAKRPKLDESVIAALIEVLAEDTDPVSQEWATVALRKLKHDQRVLDALWERLRDEQERESLRCWAMTALGRMGQHLPADELRAVYQARRENPSDVLLNTAIHWTGQNATDPTVLDALLGIQSKQALRQPPDHVLEVTIGAAVLRCTRGCLAAGTIVKQWLRDRGQQDLIRKLGETRIERLIEAERARLNQRPLLPDLEDDGPDTPLVPGHPLADVQLEQYVQDMAAIHNVRIGEKRSFIRDQSLARDAKRDAGDRCQICGEGKEGKYARGFVEAHHVQPPLQGGVDVRGNLVVLCRNCHARVHARELKIEVEGDCLYVQAGDTERRSLKLGDGGRSVAEIREDAAYRNILNQFERLPDDRKQALIEKLGEKLGTA